MRQSITFVKTIKFAGSLLLLGFLITPLSAQDGRKIVIGISNPYNISEFPIYLAKELGYFRDEGFDPQLIVMNSDLSVKALVTGDVNYASSTASVAKAASVGFPVKIVVSFFNGSDFSLVVKPEIKTPKDLKGKILAISRFGSAADSDLREALKHLGLDPAKDVKIIPVGAGSNRLIALTSGKVDGSVINVSESLRAQEQGMRVLVSTGQFNRQPFTGLGAATSRISNNREEIIKTLRAVMRGLEDFKERKDKIRPFLIKHTKTKPEHFEFVYQKNLEVLSADGLLTEADCKASYDSARKDAVTPPPVQITDLFDFAPLREARRR